MGGSLFPLTTAEELAKQIKCVEREIKLREYVYPNRVAARRMPQDLADRELEGMRAVRETLLKLRDEGDE